mmetsp:Transcript_24470/g.34549  ORF Transcript_24470/g.34549 Transcript_24470/m.34549 type:complete len:264 (-) Transcript_24470:49-840(-)
MLTEEASPLGSRTNHITSFASTTCPSPPKNFLRCWPTIISCLSSLLRSINVSTNESGWVMLKTVFVDSLRKSSVYCIMSEKARFQSKNPPEGEYITRAISLFLKLWAWSKRTPFVSSLMAPADISIRPSSGLARLRLAEESKKEAVAVPLWCEAAPSRRDKPGLTFSTRTLRSICKRVASSCNSLIVSIAACRMADCCLLVHPHNSFKTWKVSFNFLRLRASASLCLASRAALSSSGSGCFNSVLRFILAFSIACSSAAFILG